MDIFKTERQASPARAAECCYVKVSEKGRALKTAAKHLAAEKGDRGKALSKLQATLEWRNSDHITVNIFAACRGEMTLPGKWKLSSGPIVGCA